MWYQISIEVTSPQAEDVIEVVAVVRKAAVVEISLDNPTTGALEFDVSIEGEGLIGDAKYTLAASGENTAAYELIYSPLLSGSFSGRISFVNDRVGEFWYRLALRAVAAPPIIIDTIECIVGDAKVINVPLENPLPEQVTLAVSVSDAEHFMVMNDTVTLGPYAQSFFPLTFRPSSLTEPARADIFLSHQTFGEVQYQVTGIGQLPGIMPMSRLYAPLGEIGSHAIMFRNPFPYPLPVDIVLSEENTLEKGGIGDGQNDVSPVFSILLRKFTDLVIPAKSPLQISISFSPTRLGQYSGTVQVRSSISGRNLLWCFPVEGMADAGAPQELPRMVTACKTSLLRNVDVRLEGLRKADLLPGEKLSLADFSHETITDVRNNALVNRSFRAQPLELIEVVAEDEGSGVSKTDYIVRYRMLFEPLRTFMASIEMVVVCNKKGRWRLTIEVESTDPEPDDTIKLIAAVGGVDKVTFRLSNRFLGFSNFQAYFSARSSAHFTVSPAAGVLAPYGSDGTPFIVTFAPMEYGSREIANLIIITDDTQWNYEVQGSYPEIALDHSVIRSKTDSGLNR